MKIRFLKALLVHSLSNAPYLHCPKGVKRPCRTVFFYRQSAAGTSIQPFVYGSGIESSRSVEGWKRKYHYSLNRSITLTRDPKVDSEIGTIFILNEMIFEALSQSLALCKSIMLL